MLETLMSNDFLSAIIAFVIVLIPAVIIHEFGHFLAAKAVGITVLEFGVGFPPRAAKLFNWGETEFTLNWLPLGGFVRPLGEDMIRPLSEAETAKAKEALLDRLNETAASSGTMSDRATEPPAVDGYISEREELAARGIVNVRSISEVKPLPRIFFMAAGALANFISALVIFIIIGLIGVGQPAGARVGLVTVPAGSMLAQAGFQDGDFIETLNGEQFDTSRGFFRQLSDLTGKEVTVTLRREAVTEEVVITFTPDQTSADLLAAAAGELLVASVSEGSPAELAGIKPDDIIVAFAGTDLISQETPFPELQRLSQQYEGQATTVTVQRGGETFTLNLTPRVDPPAGVGRLGVGINSNFNSAETGIVYVDGPRQLDYVPLSLGEAISYGFERMIEIMRSIIEFPVRLLRQETQPEENRIISVVGVSQLGSEFLRESIQEDRPTVILNFIALISVALGVTNLLPIPALDGGRIVFVLVEMVRGKPIAPEREGVIHLIGLAFLLSIGILFMLNDVLNPLTSILP